MKITKTLILVLAVLFAGTIVQAQRGGAPRGGGGGGNMSTERSPGIGSAGLGSPNWNDETTRNSTAELKMNDKLAGRLKPLLPEGANPRYLAKGFVELKEFVATVRASNNLKVPFGDLKHKMADGSTKELQKAIHELKPDADAKAEAKKASEQAKQDIKESK
jgi:hypothetical protein